MAKKYGWKILSSNDKYGWKIQARQLENPAK
jgi:hypothetical protein